MDPPYAHAFLNIRGSHTITKTDDKFCNLLDIDDIFVLLICTFLSLHSSEWVDGFGGLCKFGVHGNDLGTPRNLQWMLFAHALSICGEIPKVR